MKITRTPVPLTEKERTEIIEAMGRSGIRTMADFLRTSALRIARSTKDE